MFNVFFPHVFTFVFFIFVICIEEQTKFLSDVWGDYMYLAQYTDDAYSPKYQRRNGQNFPCLKCGKWYSTRSIQLRHTNHECGVEKKIKCQICQKKFRRKWNLEQHTKRVHHA